MHEMRNQGVEKYGAGAYGPGGAIINTDSTFTVKQEFMSTVNYSELWGIRTTLT